MFLYRIFNAVSLLLSVLSWAIFAYCILTWIAPRSPLCRWLERFIEPFCAPFRALSRTLMMRWGAPLDFTCWFALIAIQILNNLLWKLYSLLAF